MKKHSPVISASTPKMESTMQIPRLQRARRGQRRHTAASQRVSIGRISRLMMYAKTTPIVTGRSTVIIVLPASASSPRWDSVRYSTMP